jgi:hypothetical protein
MFSTDFRALVCAGGSKKAYLTALLNPASAWVPEEHDSCQYHCMSMLPA